MRSSTTFARRIRRSAGVGIVTAIFLLVVLAGLGVAAVRIFNAQQASSSLDLDGARAYQAARAGIEWGLYQRLRNNRCGEKTFALPLDSVLGNFTVTVKCVLIPGPKDAAGNDAHTNRWRIEAVACNQVVNGRCDGEPGASPDFVRRRLEVQL